MSRPLFYTYILTNAHRTVLYTGVTNNLQRRLLEHWIGKPGSFTTKYKTIYLVWYETSHYVLNAIAMEKEVKNMSRAKKNALITAFNPDWTFLNEQVLNNWPPTAEDVEMLHTYLKGNPAQHKR